MIDVFSKHWFHMECIMKLATVNIFHVYIMIIMEESAWIAFFGLIYSWQQVRLFLSEESPSQVGMGTQDHLQAKPWLLQGGGMGSEDNLPPGFELIPPANPWAAKLSHISLVKWKCPPRVCLLNFISLFYWSCQSYRLEVILVRIKVSPGGCKRLWISYLQIMQVLIFILLWSSGISLGEEGIGGLWCGGLVLILTYSIYPCVADWSG